MACKDCRFIGPINRSHRYPCGKMGIFINDIEGYCEYEEPIERDDLTLDLFGEEEGK